MKQVSFRFPAKFIHQCKFFATFNSLLPKLRKGDSEGLLKSENFRRRSSHLITKMMITLY